MDVDAMDELMYDTLIRYFKTLAHTGYKSYDAVFKMLVMDFIYEITHTELRYYITNKDIKLMQDLLYQFFGSTCEISFPTNNRPCCVCVCCNGEGTTTTPPIVVPTTTTTTSTRPPVVPAYLILSSTVAKTAYVDYGLVEMQTPINVEVGSKVTIQAQVVIGYAFKGFYVEGSLISSSNVLQYTIPSAGTNTIELRYEEEANTTTTTSSQPPVVPTTTTTSTLPPPVEYYMVSMVSNIPCSVVGNFGGDDISGEVTSNARIHSIERSNVPSGTINAYSAKEPGYIIKGIYDVSSGALLPLKLPYTWVGSKELRFEFEKEDVTTTITTTTTSSTTTSTVPPIKTATVVFKHDSRTAYTVTYNGSSDKLTVSNSEDEEIKLDFPTGTDSRQFRIDSIVCTNPNYECDRITQGELPYSINIAVNQNIIITPVITASESTDTTTTSSTTTTTTSTSSQPPIVGNNVYYGVIEDYMSPFNFRDMPIKDLMEREGTKPKVITGTGVNEFAIPQTGYYSYLIIPKNKVELLYAAFTSSGITTVYYDSTKENILNDTNNGAFYSKYTRGGVNANQGGTYNGIDYDVYFAYLASGGANIPINVQAKNK